jgi:hypothetical protein
MSWILIIYFWFISKFKDIIIYTASVVHSWKILVFPNGLPNFISNIQLYSCAIMTTESF